MNGFGNAQNLAWHYTDATRLLALLHSKALKLKYSHPYCDEKPVIWLTRSNQFEPMALYPHWQTNETTKNIPPLQAIAEESNGLIRIGIPIDGRLATFREWKITLRG